MDIPDFVPPGVAAIARHVASGPYYTDVTKRLLTDERMSAVWSTLLKQNVRATATQLFHSYQRMETWGLNERYFSLPDQACAAFYAYAVIECNIVGTFGTVADADALAEPYYSAARICRQMLTTPPYPSPEESAALETAAKYIEEQISWQHKHLLANPRIVGKRTNRVRGFDNHQRGTLRILAKEAYRIFGSYHYQTVSTVANVVLNLNGRKKIGKSEAIAWCKGLESRPRRRSLGRTRRGPRKYPD